MSGHRILFAAAVLCWAAAAPVSGQSVLAGVHAVRFDLVVEGPRSAVDDSSMAYDLFQTASLEALADVPLNGDAPARLDVHVNVVDAGRGLFPFTVSVSLRENVVVRGSTVEVATWDTQTTGLASHDRLGLVVVAVEGAVREFADAFVSARR